jgi:hypothetical protein
MIQLFSFQLVMHRSLFEDPRGADRWLREVEDHLVLDVWHHGYLPTAIIWDLWMEPSLLGGAEYIPMVKVEMRVMDRHR